MNFAVVWDVLMALIGVAALTCYIANVDVPILFGLAWGAGISACLCLAWEMRTR